MSDLLKAASENDVLRRCMDNLLTITTLPETWKGESAADICNSLLNVLAEIVDVDFLFLRIIPQNGQPKVEIARIRPDGGLSHTAELSGFLSQLLGDVVSSGRRLRSYGVTTPTMLPFSSTSASIIASACS